MSKNNDKDEKEVYIKITKDGPYLVYGCPEISSKTIVCNDEKVAIEYSTDKIFEIHTEPVALCRCGNTKNPPFCDGSHCTCCFDGTEKASYEPILNKAKKYEGPNLILYDNEEYCACARFCDANGTIWSLVYEGTTESDEMTVREANLCPAGRLMVYDKEGNSFEYELPKAVSALEDGGLHISGPLWVQGMIRVESSDGRSYEIRNRQTLCRCGKSKNKPFCDCSHQY